MNALSILLFVLALNNVTAIVSNSDVLSGKERKTWVLGTGEKFSKCTKGVNYELCGEVCISNPPFNIKWEPPIFSLADKRFTRFGCPPANNANYAFILTCLDRAERSAVVLPNGVLTSSNKEEEEIRKNLIEANMIEAVIGLPDHMFESTNIPTCILVLNKKKKSKKIVFIDLSEDYEEKTREQRGQFGGKTHTNRVYKKKYKVLNDEVISKTSKAIDKKRTEKDFCISCAQEIVRQNNYILSPKRFVEHDFGESEHRDFDAIVDDINKCISEKNLCKLTINVVLAKNLNIDLSSFANSDMSEVNSLLKNLCNKTILKEDYFSISKNKTEFKFSNNSKTEVSSVLTMLLQTWKQHLYFLNEKENVYLAELRDALLPKLMDGSIEIGGVNNVREV